MRFGLAAIPSRGFAGSPDGTRGLSETRRLVIFPPAPQWVPGREQISQAVAAETGVVYEMHEPRILDPIQFKRCTG
jgi:hypothetical protein